MPFSLRNLEIQKEENSTSSFKLQMTYIFIGDLSEYNSYMLRNNIEKWFDNGFPEYVFDLRKLTNLDIAGVNFLVQLKELVNEVKANFSAIVPYKKNVLEPIYLTKLGDSLNVEYYLDNDFEE